MVKSVKEKIDEVVQGKKQGVKLTFTWETRADAVESMKKRGMEFDEATFEGPDFKDVIGYQVNGDWVAVSLPTGETYIYPSRGIARIKHYTVE